jgi:hypothetical protein
VPRPGMPTCGWRLCLVEKVKEAAENIRMSRGITLRYIATSLVLVVALALAPTAWGRKVLDPTGPIIGLPDPIPEDPPPPGDPDQDADDKCLDDTLIDPVTLYIAPWGSDENLGSFDAPFASLEGADTWISSQGFTNDYHIYVRDGTYTRHEIQWHNTSPERRIRIEAYPGEQPIFDGEGRGVRFFDLRAQAGQASNVTIKALTIQGYVQHGIRLHGNRNNSAGWNSCNRIVDNTFINHGTKFADCTGDLISDSDQVCAGYGVIDLVHSRRNLLSNNVIVHSENTDAGITGPHHIHAFYVAHGSIENHITGNTISHCSGDPIKLRDAANDNIIERNYLAWSGDKAFIVDSPSAGEANSTGNIVRDNIATFPYPGRTNVLMTRKVDSSSLSFIIDSAQTDGKQYQGQEPAQEQVTAIAAGDLDGDQNSELLVALYYPDLGFTKVLRSAGGADRYLRYPVYSSTYWTVPHMALGDFDGSGHDQVITHFWNAEKNHTQIHRSGAEFGPAGLTGLGKIYESALWEITAIAAGDFDDDARDELATAFLRNGETRIYTGDGINSATGNRIYTSTIWTVPAMTTGDFHSDPGDELISAFESATTTRIYSGNGVNSALSHGHFYSNPSWTINALAAGDYAGTGSPQLISAFRLKSTGENRIYRGSGTSATDLGSFYSSSLWTVASLAAGQFNADTTDELVTAFNHTTETQIHTGNGTNSAFSESEFHRWPVVTGQSPPPPPPCPSGERCCEPGPDGCHLCVPTNAECP